MLYLKYPISSSIPRSGMFSTFVIVITLLIGGSFGIGVLDGLNSGVVYQFELTTQTRLTNREQTKTVEEQESSAVIFAHFLHWDKDSQKRVIVIWADNCVNAPCPRTKDGSKRAPPLKLFSIWRGPKVSEILVPDSPGAQKWDVLRSLLFHLQYELETAKLRSAGLCNTKYSETDPKSRQLIFCRQPEQACLFDTEKLSFDVTVSNFTQTSQYFFDGSSKLRQLAIREQYEFWSPLFPVASTVLISNSRLKLIDQSQSSHAVKDEGVGFDAYVEILKKENNLHRVSDSVEQLFADAAAPEHAPAAHTSTAKCGSLGGIETLQRLIPSSKIDESLRTLLNLTQDLRSVDQSHLLECLKFVDESHDTLLQPLLGALAVSGHRNIQKTVFQFLETTTKDEAQRYYLIMLAHNLWPEKLAPEVVAHFEKSLASSANNPHDHFALAAASLARRSGDVELQEQLLKILDKLLGTCDSDECLEVALRAFRNLAHPKTGSYVGKFFCDKSVTVVREALEAMRAVDAKSWTHETLKDLARVYRNKCPKGNSDSSSRTSAADMLLKVKPDRLWAAGVGSILLAPLRSEESRWRSKREREIYTYSLARLFDLADLEKDFKPIFNQFVKDVLKNDYNRLSPGGLSSAHTTVAADVGFARALSRLTMEYSRGVPKRGNMDIQLEISNGLIVPLLSVALISRDLDIVAPGSSAFADDDDPMNEEEDGQEIMAGMRLVLLDRLQPPMTFFTGHTGLMSILWNLNGEPMSAFEGQFLINNLRGFIPLASGHRAKAQLGTALWWKMTGSVEVSLWNGNGHTVITTHLNAVVSGSISVKEDGVPETKAILRDETELSAGVTIDFVTDLEISRAPYRICLQLNQEPLQIKYQNRHSRRDSIKKKRQAWKREKVMHIQGHCFLTEPKIARTCNVLLQHLGKEE